MKKPLLVTRRIWSHNKAITYRMGRKTASVASLAEARDYAIANGNGSIKVAYK